MDLDRIEANAKRNLGKPLDFIIDPADVLELVAMARGNGCDDHHTDFACHQAETIAELEECVEKAKALCDQLAAAAQEYIGSHSYNDLHQGGCVLSKFDAPCDCGAKALGEALAAYDAVREVKA